jgi:hypothetical protein
MHFLSLPIELQLEILALSMPTEVILNVVHELTTEAQGHSAHPKPRPAQGNDIIAKIGCYSGTGHIHELHTARYRLSWEPKWVPELMFLSKAFTPLVRSLLCKTMQIRVSEQSVRETATGGVGMLTIFDRRIGDKVPWVGQVPNVRLGGLSSWITSRARTLLVRDLEPERAARGLSFLDIDSFASLREVTIGRETVLSDTMSCTGAFDMLEKLEDICRKDGIHVQVDQWKACSDIPLKGLLQQVLRRADRPEENHSAPAVHAKKLSLSES